MSGVGDQLFEFGLPCAAVHWQIDRLSGEAGVDHDVGQFDGAESLCAGGDEGFAVEDGVHKIGHQLGVRCFGSGDRDFLDGGLRLLEADLGSLTPFVRWHGVAGEGELVVFQNDPSLGSGDLESIAAGGLAAGGDERTSGAVRKFHVAGDVILDFDVVPFADADVAADAAGHAGDPLHGVELVQALVEQHAAAFAFPRGAPAAALEIDLGAKPVGHNPEHTYEVAQFAALHDLANLLITRFDAELEHTGEHLVRMCVGLGDEPLGIRLVCGDRFFHHDVEAGLKRGDAKRGVLIMWCSDEQRVDLSAGNHLLAATENFDALFAVLLEFVWGGAANGDEFTASDLAVEQVVGMEATHVAHADDANAYFVHERAGECATGRALGQARGVFRVDLAKRCASFRAVNEPR